MPRRIIGHSGKWVAAVPTNWYSPGMKHLLGILSLMLVRSALAAPTQLTCAVKGDVEKRMFTLSQVADPSGEKVWAITMRSRKTSAQGVILELRNKTPELKQGSLSLAYESFIRAANVDWKVDGGTASLAIFVRHDEEINDNEYKIPPEPDVDLMNLDKTTELECRFE